jgi:hypothetical protein
MIVSNVNARTATIVTIKLTQIHWNLINSPSQFCYAAIKALARLFGPPMEISRR